MAPNISVRDSVRWLPDAAEEPTSTIVLTSGENRFVDIRILKKSDHADLGHDPVLPFKRLDWAFAGVSSSRELHDKDGNAYAHSAWQHWVSDRTKDADSVKDEGDMYPMSDGRTLEKGSMTNPATGVKTEYEEMWRDVKVAKVTQPSEDVGKEGVRKCVVLVLHEDEREARGMVVRVGQFVQGVLRVGDHFSLERWEWHSAWQNGGWKRSVRMGDLWLPCSAAMEDGKVRLGGEVKYGEFVWKVVELQDF
ncbi:hypothetical protein LTR62_008388 [Meristemomyces frigidus]|uniref:Protein HRI1 n=1 Tax=Meristemomyces frigidus TaxID=1508187 RepID=A0AAN7TAQ7_9PEZI|nr:hypothetical protein LTR62_008388 [Meristemomyces frigidus]